MASVPAGPRRLRVLTLIDYLDDSSGGAERFALALAAHLPRDRVEPWICATRSSDPATAARFSRLGIPHVALGRRSKLDVHRFAGLLALLRRERFDVLHAHMFGSNLWGALFGRACGIPVVLAHEHNWSFEGEPLRAWLDGRVIGRLATRFIAVSAATGERMISVEHVPREKVLVLPTAYVPHPIHAPHDLRAELGVPPGAPLLAVAAVLRPEKHLEVLLDAMLQVLAHHPRTVLVIAGEGPRRSALEAHARRLGLGAQVRFLGIRSDVEEILRLADAGVMSSDWEGMPLFAFECMATGTPLVATAVGGLTEILRDGESALLVPPNDPDRLAGTLIRLLDDPPLGARLAAAARERLDEHRIERVAARFAEIYAQLAETAAPPPRVGADLQRRRWRWRRTQPSRI